MVLVPLDVFDKLPKTLKQETELYLLTWASVVATVHIEGITRQGRIKFKAVTTNDRVISISTFPIPEFPLFLQVNASGYPRHGTVYHHLALAKSGMGLMTLSSGYLTSARSWFPPAHHEHMEEGPGNIRVVTGTDPAAGVEIIEAVPTNALWRILAFNFTLVTDATVITRKPSLQFDDGATVVHYMMESLFSDATASLSTTYSFTRNAGGRKAASTTARTILPEIRLPQGFRIMTATGSLQAGDNYGAPVILVEEWLQE